MKVKKYTKMQSFPPWWNKNGTRIVSLQQSLSSWWSLAHYMITGFVWTLGLIASSGSSDKRALTTHDSSGCHVRSRARDRGERSQNFISNYSGVAAVMNHGGDAATKTAPTTWGKGLLYSPFQFQMSTFPENRCIKVGYMAKLDMLNEENKH